MILDTNPAILLKSCQGGKKNNLPDFSIEKEYNKNVVGIDEVGRGPLAGPVISSAVIFFDHEMNNDSFKLINDSKKLSKINRIKIFKLIYKLQESKKIKFSLGMASV